MRIKDYFKYIFNFQSFIFLFYLLETLLRSRQNFVYSLSISILWPKVRSMWVLKLYRRAQSEVIVPFVFEVSFMDMYVRVCKIAFIFTYYVYIFVFWVTLNYCIKIISNKLHAVSRSRQGRQRQPVLTHSDNWGQFSPNPGGTACWVAELNAAL